MKKILVIGLLLFWIGSVIVQGMFFDYNELSQLEHGQVELQLLFYSPFETLDVVETELEKVALEKKEMVKEISIIENTKPENLEILITEEGFEPKELVVEVDQIIIWKNQREKLPALVLGLREISEMKSSYMEPGEEFGGSISATGEYTYVDGIIIGQVGKIIVK
ncbi:MAG: hypothetical protein KKH52_01950 [Nanoarchaeota archaeon]|nr:hypothetical protein [Nanoarchaeota archaeon]MBU1622311.1 hypothetical protein [Nanoarchaeota archaeon]MBU1974134.1 hypothetical protein [Nanoarchaeota archaeon]